MLIALVDNERAAATPKQKGQCPHCSKPVTARCGEQRIWHWAHLTKTKCDSWREKETAWHRQWKNEFPKEWQEISHKDESTGLTHIADICTKFGLVIEFQHSRLDPQERRIRDNFYGNLVWVVNGSRLKNDYKRFLKQKSTFDEANRKDSYHVPFPDKCFPAEWLDCSGHVIFDFQGDPSNPPDGTRESLWCLMPKGKNDSRTVCVLSRKEFVAKASSSRLLFADELREFMAQLTRDKQEMAENQARTAYMNELRARMRGRNRRHF